MYVHLLSLKVYNCSGLIHLTDCQYFKRQKNIKILTLHKHCLVAWPLTFGDNSLLRTPRRVLFFFTSTDANCHGLVSIFTMRRYIPTSYVWTFFFFFPPQSQPPREWQTLDIYFRARCLASRFMKQQVTEAMMTMPTNRAEETPTIRGMKRRSSTGAGEKKLTVIQGDMCNDLIDVNRCGYQTF